jgi:hypothetical protein
MRALEASWCGFRLRCSRLRPPTAERSLSFHSARNLFCYTYQIITTRSSVKGKAYRKSKCSCRIMMVGVVADCGLEMIDIITDWCA